MARQKAAQKKTPKAPASVAPKAPQELTHAERVERIAAAQRTGNHDLVAKVRAELGL